MERLSNGLFRREVTSIAYFARPLFRSDMTSNSQSDYFVQYICTIELELLTKTQKQKIHLFMNIYAIMIKYIYIYIYYWNFQFESVLLWCTHRKSIWWHQKNKHIYTLLLNDVEFVLKRWGYFKFFFI